MVYHTHMDINTNDLVGFCPHENLLGIHTENGGNAFVVGSSLRMSFVGKKRTMPHAKVVASGVDHNVKEVKVKKASNKKAAVKEVVESVADEPLVKDDVAVEIAPEVGQPVAVEQPVEAEPVAAEAEAPVQDEVVEVAPKKAKKSSKKKA